LNSPPETRIAFVRLAGDIDLAGEAELDEVSHQLAESLVGRIYVDLAAVTFAGSTLLNFVFDLAVRSPGQPAVILCQPASLLSRIFELTGLNKIASVRAEPGADWDALDPSLTGLTAIRLAAG
jgi:anti-anti-sigma factor